jgi:lysyl-tRNA synthetase class I
MKNEILNVRLIDLTTLVNLIKREDKNMCVGIDTEDLQILLTLVKDANPQEKRFLEYFHKKYIIDEENQTPAQIDELNKNFYNHFGEMVAPEEVFYTISRFEDMNCWVMEKFLFSNQEEAQAAIKVLKMNDIINE